MINVPLPPNWEQRIDPNSGAIYYANVVTRESTWERPLPPDYKPTDLPLNWEERLDPASGRCFYYNKVTKVTQWEKPSMEEAQPAEPPPAKEEATPVQTLPPPKTATTQTKTAPAPSSAPAKSGSSLPHALNDPNIRGLKFVTVGDGAVGKTCLLISFIRKEFCADYVPTVFDNKSEVVEFEGKEYNLGIWDTAGQEEYDRLRPLSYPSTDCFLMCFSIASPPSLDNCRLKWKTELTHYCPDAKILLIGTKQDLRNDPQIIKQLNEDLHTRPVLTSDGENMAKELGCAKYLECSAKQCLGVKEVFYEAIRVCTVPIQKKKKKCVIL